VTSDAAAAVVFAHLRDGVRVSRDGVVASRNGAFCTASCLRVSPVADAATQGEVAASFLDMTLHSPGDEVGVRELHDRLSEYLDRVEGGAEIVVTRRGRPIARISGVDAVDPLAELVERGLVRPPAHPRRPRRPRVRARGSVSELVGEQRR
jgi:prevent-host-death family protein